MILPDLLTCSSFPTSSLYEWLNATTFPEESDSKKAIHLFCHKCVFTVPMFWILAAPYCPTVKLFQTLHSKPHSKLVSPVYYLSFLNRVSINWFLLITHRVAAMAHHAPSPAGRGSCRLWVPLTVLSPWPLLPTFHLFSLWDISHFSISKSSAITCEKVSLVLIGLSLYAPAILSIWCLILACG